MTNDQGSSDDGRNLYHRLLDTAPDAIVVVSPDGAITYVNLQVEKIFGYPRRELVGAPLDVLIPERFRGGHKGHMARYFAAANVRPMGSGLELFGRRADGTEIPIEVSLSPVQTENGVLVSAAIRDITERRRTEAAARLTAERLASAIESVQDAFALFDASDRLVLCNSVYRRLLGETSGPVVGRTYDEIVAAWSQDLDFPTERDRDRFRAERRAKRNEPGGAFDVRTRDGRWLRVVDRRTAEGGIVKVIWDLTDDVLRAEELRQARATAESASSAKSEFLSSMSHELRTPLNAILGFAQLLQRDKKEPLSTRHRDRVEQILKGGEHLLRLIDDILDLSHIEAGRVSLSMEPVDVREVLDELLTTLEPAAARAGVRIALADTPPDLPPIAADRTRLTQILMNYGSNGIKYNRPGGTVTFEVSRVGDGRLRVTVTDTGMGIPAAKQHTLFQPFQRAGQETGPIEGTGIGLTISKRLAELMGGEVGFRSVPSQGSAFWVDVPVHHAASVASDLPVAAGSGTSQLDRHGDWLVLYVEDNPANVRFMRDLLSGFESVELIVATTAEAGIELARERRPRVIIMDINLPGMSGLDALRALRDRSDTKDIPVIALTAAASARDRQRGEAAGFYRYLTKPVKIDELEAALEGLLAPE
jgi:PAS domain S-box-containing protein